MLLVVGGGSGMRCKDCGRDGGKSRGQRAV